MDIAIVSYRRFTEMPRDVHNACCLMGYSGGHLRKLAENRYLRNGEPHFILREALVMFVNGMVVGWAALYDAWGVSHPCASVWVKDEHRGKGYGSQLIEDMHDRWYTFKPEVFYSVVRTWQGMDYVKDNQTQISPNASVTRVPLYTGYASQSLSHPTQ